MTTTFRLPADELDESFIERVKEMFRKKQIAIIVYEENEMASHSEAALPLGMNMEDLRRFRGSISNEDAKEMKQAIEEECERIDPEGW